MEIRPVRPEEHAAAGALVVAAYRALSGTALSDSYAEQLADVDARAREAEVLVAVDGAEVLGCVTYVPDAASPYAQLLGPEEAAIRMLGVAPALQGRGVGAALLAACVERARVSGRVALVLHTTPSMSAAHRLYERAGFVRLPERDWYPNPDVPLLAFRLSLD